MSLTLELPPELEKQLSVEAEQLGLPLPQYAVRLLASRPGGGAPLQTGAELGAYWQKEGLVGSRPDIADSQEHARRLRQQASAR